MKLGVVFPETEIGADPSAIRDYAEAVEGAGFDHLLVFDHVLGAGRGGEHQQHIPGVRAQVGPLPRGPQQFAGVRWPALGQSEMTAPDVKSTKHTPRMADGHPDFSGYWKGTRDTRPVGNIGKDLPGFKLPLTSAGEAALKHNLTATIDPDTMDTSAMIWPALSFSRSASISNPPDGSLEPMSRSRVVFAPRESIFTSSPRLALRRGGPGPCTGRGGGSAGCCPVAR